MLDVKEVVKNDLICDRWAIVACPVKTMTMMIVERFDSPFEKMQGTLFELDCGLLSL